MWFKNCRLTFLAPQNAKRDLDLRRISDTIMKAESRGGMLYFKGKSSPRTGPDDPWFDLEWNPDTRTGRKAHHLMLRFGEQPSISREGNGRVRKPGPNCPRAIRYLLHGSNLMVNSQDDPAAHSHDICHFDAPVGIFWGLLGLRSLKNWWVVKELINEGLWFHEDPRPPESPTPDFDPESYRPTLGTLPEGFYLYIRIAIPWGSADLTHNFFRFKPQGEISIDDGYAYSSGTEDSNYPPSGDGEDDDHNEEYQDPEDGNQVVLFNRPYTRDEEMASGYRYRRPESDRRAMSPTRGGYDDSQRRVTATSQKYRDLPKASSPPLIPAGLRMDTLYMKRKSLKNEKLFLKQSKGDHKHLIFCGTGIDLEEYGMMRAQMQEQVDALGEEYAGYTNSDRPGGAHSDGPEMFQKVEGHYKKRRHSKDVPEDRYYHQRHVDPRFYDQQGQSKQYHLDDMEYIHEEPDRSRYRDEDVHHDRMSFTAGRGGQFEDPYGSPYSSREGDVGPALYDFPPHGHPPYYHSDDDEEDYEEEYDYRHRR
ncbi:hypothetical protein AA313_de0205570 [Arthrobotrys entomopaga]|nr:hypothetical protein AA313_de0205570 [Arthrobotrys entomopaga]